MFQTLVMMQRAMRHCNLFSKKRSKWKGPYVLPVPADLKIYKRTMTILPQFVGKVFQVSAPLHPPRRPGCFLINSAALNTIFG